MEYITNFVNNHMMLSSLFLILLIALIANEWYLRNMGIPSVSPQLLVDWMNHLETKVVDIRHLSAFQEGHILNSTHLPASQFTAKINTLKKYLDKPLVLVCVSGQEAAKAAVYLQQQGFKQVYILNGGLQAWRAAGLPLEKRS